MATVQVLPENGDPNVMAIDDLLQESGFKRGVIARPRSNGYEIEAVDGKVSEATLRAIVNRVRTEGKLSRSQSDRLLRDQLLTKQVWSNQDRDAALRLILERMVL